MPNIVTDLQRGTTAFNDIETALKNKGVIGEAEVVPVEDFDDRIADIQSALQTKTVTVDTNGSTEITPDQDYDGLDRVNLTVAVPVPVIEHGKTATISQNGTSTINPSSGKDAMDAVEVTVDVHFPEITDLYHFFYENHRDYDDWEDYIDFSEVDNFYQAFYKNNLTSIDLGTGLKATNYEQAFYQCPNLESVHIGSLTYPDTDAEKAVIRFTNMFCACPSLEEVTADDDPLILYGKTNNMFGASQVLTAIPALKYIILDYQYAYNGVSFVSMFEKVSSIEEIDLTIIDQQVTSPMSFSFEAMFKDCAALKYIKGNLDMTHAGNISNMFSGCTNLISIETTGSICALNNSAVTLDLSASTVFNIDSFIESLAANNTGQTRTIKVNSTVYANFTKQAEATAKNYTVQSA